MSSAIHWPSTITYTIDSRLDYDAAAIDRALRGWESVLPQRFVQVPLDGQFAVAPLADVLAAFAIDADLVAVAVTLVSEQAATGLASSFGLDHARPLAAGWAPRSDERRVGKRGGQ